MLRYTSEHARTNIEKLWARLTVFETICHHP